MENHVLPFQLERTNIRGRIVRLDDVLDQILTPHAYPAPVLHLTGEMAVLCALLSSMLKYEGIFTLQAQGQGDIRMLVADVTSEGGLRSCASFKEEAFSLNSTQYDPELSHAARLLGEGYMAFTVDQAMAERYQGIVELKPESLISSVQHYFAQSEQISTGILVAVGRGAQGWRGCGIMVQQMPDETNAYNKDQSNVDEDDWRRTMILMGSLRKEEMLAGELSDQEILYRLFHEEGVRVYEPKKLFKTCRCDEGRVKTVLEGMPSDDIAHMSVDGTIRMTCEFCSKTYSFPANQFMKGH